MITDLDKGQQSVKMPMLTFKRDVQRDHPIVNDFSSDYLLTWPLRVFVVEPCCSHLSVYIGVDVFDVLFRKMSKDF